MTVTWRWHEFSGLSGAQVYALLRLRMEVFVVEQACAFLDADGLDAGAWHLLGVREGALVACARVLPPGVTHPEPAIGRVVTAGAVRRTGLGRALMNRAIEFTEERYPGLGIALGAQRYLEPFYGSLGFVPRGEPYLEDGIPHVGMVRPPPDR